MKRLLFATLLAAILTTACAAPAAAPAPTYTPYPTYTPAPTATAPAKPTLQPSPKPTRMTEEARITRELLDSGYVLVVTHDGISAFVNSSDLIVAVAADSWGFIFPDVLSATDAELSAMGHAAGLTGIVLGYNDEVQWAADQFSGALIGGDISKGVVNGHDISVWYETGDLLVLIFY